jgi:hypothetical protein
MEVGRERRERGESEGRELFRKNFRLKSILLGLAVISGKNDVLQSCRAQRDEQLCRRSFS